MATATSGSPGLNKVRREDLPFIDVTLPPYNATGNGTTDDTAAIQAAIDAAAANANGGTVFFPSGTYSVSDLDIPGAGYGVVNLLGTGGSVLLGRSGTAKILTYATDIGRRGGKSIKSLRINGDDTSGAASDIIGIHVGQVLQLHAEDVFIEKCDTAWVIDSIQECTFENCIGSRSRIGWYLINPSGGLTVSNFNRCSAQDNSKMGWLIDGSLSAAPAHTLTWTNCLFQVNYLCALYTKTLGQGILSGCHIEWNARSPSSTTETVTVPATVGGYSYTIDRSVIHADYASNIEISHTEIPEAVSTLVMQITRGSVISADSVGGAGLAGADFVRTDANSSFKPTGMLSTFLGGGYYHTWPKTVNYNYRGVLYGVPVFTPSSDVANEIVAVDGTLAATGSDLTASTAFDATFGRVSSYQFTSSVGSSSANRARCTVWTSDTLLANDNCVFTTLARVASGGIKEVVIDAGGTGYTTATIGFTGGGGSGATADAVLTAGVITGITMTAEGTGYTSVPTVDITGDGTGASAAAIVGADVSFRQPLSVPLTRVVRVTLDWMRIVSIGVNNNDASGSAAQFYFWASDTTAALLYLSKYQSYRVPISKRNARNTALLNRIVAEGLVSVAGLSQVELSGRKTYDVSNLADATGETTTVTVTGAALGDFAVASLNVDTLGITITAWVSAADTVSVRFQNETGGDANPSVGTLVVLVRKR